MLGAWPRRLFSALLVIVRVRGAVPSSGKPPHASTWTQETASSLTCSAPYVEIVVTPWLVRLPSRAGSFLKADSDLWTLSFGV